MTKFIQLLVFTFITSSIQAATYWVDFDTGNDANNGTTTGTPWRTLPGTRNSAGTDWKQPAWGAINGAAKIAGGDQIRIKGTYSSADSAGHIWIDPIYYTDGLDTAYNQITITTDSAWGGTNDVVLDFSGITLGIAGILSQIDGITFKNGTGAGRIQIKNSVLDGIQVKETGSGVDQSQKYLWFQGIDFISNDTSILTDTAGAGSGQLNIRWSNHTVVTNCTFNGSGSHFSNGILFGDNHQYSQDYLVIDCTSFGHRGDTGTDDSGIGIKVLNGQGIINRFVSYNNLKGMDIGEQDAAISYIGDNRIYNSTFRSNIWGANWNWSDDPSGAVAKYRFVNNLIISNLFEGQHIYSQPWQAFIAHNVYAYNGEAAQAGAYSGHIQANNDRDINGDVGLPGISLELYNNVFYRGYECVFAGGYYNEATQVFTQKSDWNVYAQSTTDGGIFAQWGYYGPDAANVFWGAPWSVGSSAGQWYTFYGKSASAPTVGGTGHYQSDANSTVILTGDSENSDVNFWDVSFPTFRTKTKRNGVNLSAHPMWDSAYMGFDRLGVARTRYTIGLYDLDPTTVGGGGAGGTFADASSITINAVNQATPYPSTISVTGTAMVTNMTVQIFGLSHTDPTDVEMLLVAPNGATIVLMSDGFAGNPDAVNVNLTFADGATAIPGTACVTGTYAPTDSTPTGDLYNSPAPAAPFGTTLAAMIAGGVNGIWTLYIQDDSGGDAGSISGGWALNFTASGGGGGSTSTVTGLRPGFRF